MLSMLLLGWGVTMISTLIFGPVITMILFIIANMVELLVLSKDGGGKGIAICFCGFIPVIGFVLFGLLHKKDDSWYIALFSAISTIVMAIAVVIYMKFVAAGYYGSSDTNFFKAIIAGIPFALSFVLPKKLTD